VELSKNDSAGDTRTWTFGRFKLIPTRQLLLRDGVPVRMGSRALDILAVLVRRGGELVTKHELIAAVWPDTFVDESNLKVNICSVRRALGDTRLPPQYIATVAGRGYRFVAPVESSIVSAGIVDLRSRSSLVIVDHFHLRALLFLTVRSTQPHV
jgi:DNA-binding winged helix-turn-helix (wHTH) protein